MKDLLQLADSAQSDRTFVFAATDYTAFTIRPEFITRMQEIAPKLRFKVVHSHGQESADKLASGHINFDAVATANFVIWQKFTDMT